MINLSVEERLFELGLLKFQIRASDPKAADLIEDAALIHEGKQYFITEITDTFDEKGIALKSIEAEIGWMRLADIKRVGSFSIEAQNAEQGLTAILSGTSWTAGPCFATTDFSYEGQDLTVLGLIWDWCRTVGGEPTFDTITRTVLIDQTAGAYRGLSFRYGRNLKSVERVAKPPEYTRIHPYGRNDLDITASTGGVPYLEDYSWYTDQGISLDDAKANYRKDELYSDDSITSADALYAVAQARLAISSRPTISYSAKVLNLSAISGVDESLFKVGDFATVYDEIEAGTLDARVIRLVQWPDSPEKDEVELAFNNVLLPSPNSTSQRPNQTKSWELFESRNWITPRQVRGFSTILHRLVLKVVEGGEWAVGFKLQGVGVGSSTLTVEATNDTDDSVVWTSFVEAVSDGQAVNYNFTFGQKDLPAGEYIMVIRAFSDTGGAGIDIAQGDTAYWFLARGTTRDSITLPNSIRYEQTNTLQKFIAPDDVHEVQIECVGTAGGPNVYGGAGGKVTARFPVIPGHTYDVHVGGRADYLPGGWSNGGAGGSTYAAPVGFPGGGSSHVVVENGAFADAMIVAAGGGGSGQVFHSALQRGGPGGFYEGGDGILNSVDPPNGGSFPGFGATQTAGGAVGAPGAGFPGTPGSFGQGGSAENVGNAFSFPPGGGGGGWYGGGAASSNGTSGAGTGGGGGGGSGWLGPTGYDLEVEDGANAGATGYVVISWEAPED